MGYFSKSDAESLRQTVYKTGGNVTPSDVEAAYNSQVNVATQPEAEAGTSFAVRRWTPIRLHQAILALSPIQQGAEFSLIMGRRVGIDGGSFIFGSRT